jgi:hypothetical protein
MASAWAAFTRAADNAEVDASSTPAARGRGGRPLPLFPKGSAGARAALRYLSQCGSLGMLADKAERWQSPPAVGCFDDRPAPPSWRLRFGCPIIPGRVQRLGPSASPVGGAAPAGAARPGPAGADLALTTAITTGSPPGSRSVRRSGSGCIAVWRRVAPPLQGSRSSTVGTRCAPAAAPSTPRPACFRVPPAAAAHPDFGRDHPQGGRTVRGLPFRTSCAASLAAPIPTASAHRRHHRANGRRLSAALQRDQPLPPAGRPRRLIRPARR